MVLVLGFATHLELQWEEPAFARFFDRIASFSRLIIFDKRGTGLSDPVAEVPTAVQPDAHLEIEAAGRRGETSSLANSAPPVVSAPLAWKHIVCGDPFRVSHCPVRSFGLGSR